jgi:hypothetical protein
MSPKVQRIFPLVVAFIAGVLLVALFCWLWRESGRSKLETVLPGTDLYLLGQIGPFEVYSNLDETNNNEYAIFSGNKCLVSYFKEDGTNDLWETSHFENGRGVLVTTTRESGTITKRMFTAQDTAGQDIFSYVDSDGDGQWDIMLDFADRKKFMRQQRTWVQASSVKGIRKN